jgi:hypothetical protein
LRALVGFVSRLRALVRFVSRLSSVSSVILSVCVCVYVYIIYIHIYMPGCAWTVSSSDDSRSFLELEDSHCLGFRFRV